MVWWGSIGGRWLAGLDDLGGLFQPWWCYDSVIYSWSCLVWVDWHSSSDLSQQVLQAFCFTAFYVGTRRCLMTFAFPYLLMPPFGFSSCFGSIPHQYLSTVCCGWEKPCSLFPSTLSPSLLVLVRHPGLPLHGREQWGFSALLHLGRVILSSLVEEK